MGDESTVVIMKLLFRQVSWCIQFFATMTSGHMIVIEYDCDWVHHAVARTQPYRAQGNYGIGPTIFLLSNEYPTPPR